MTPYQPPAQLRECGEDIVERLGCVRSADVIEDDPRLNTTAVKFIVGPEDPDKQYHHIPTRVIRALAEADFGVWDTSARADGHFVIVAV